MIEYGEEGISQAQGETIMDARQRRYQKRMNRLFYNELRAMREAQCAWGDTLASIALGGLSALMVWVLIIVAIRVFG